MNIMKFLIQIFLTLYIVLFSFKLFSSELKEIVLLDGVNKFQSQAISSGLSNLILEDAKYQLTKFHFPYGPHCQKILLIAGKTLNLPLDLKLHHLI